ncbi:MAG TPA: GNAT family N-acetyltransferase [Bdellovibrionota bacterium]|nr:GNAT family N-acetyltransferase [Bdellovibrionota bacterium]
MFGPLAKIHDRAAFDCGVPELNNFLKTKARQYERRNLAKTFVASPAEDPSQIAGFYSLSMNCVDFISLPDDIAHKLPQHPLPAALIGRLAVNQRAGGLGLGGLLLMDAFRQVLRASEKVACAAVLVEAKNEAAKAFYLHFGFIPFADRPNSLFLPIKTIQQLL